MPGLRRRPAGGKRATGSNFPSRADGERIHAQVLASSRGAVRPVIGLDVAFADLPAALTRMEQRDTVGRVVARL